MPRQSLITPRFLILKSFSIDLIKLINIALLRANIAKSSIYKQIISTLVVLFINKYALESNTLNLNLINLGFRVQNQILADYFNPYKVLLSLNT